MNAQHLTTDELADAAEGLLDGLRPQGHRRPYYRACCQQSGRHTGTAGLRRLRWVDAGNRGDGLWSRYALRRPVSAAASLSI